MKPLYPEALQKMLGGRTMYAELEPSRPDLRRWVSINRYRRDEQWRYVVHGFEVRSDDVEKQYDVAGTEENLIHHEFEELNDAIAKLAELIPHAIEWKTWNETDCPL